MTSTQGATCVDFEVVTYVHRGECLACKVDNNITELVVMRHDEGYLLAVKDVLDEKFHSTSNRNGPASQASKCRSAGRGIPSTPATLTMSH